MIFKELINSVNYDDVWVVLNKEYERIIAKNEKIYKMLLGRYLSQIDIG
ncbi:MAG: hypothetical protein M1475_01490 [Actinobacteria bacterium]|nr:hypothetical protein [Actinomycetota bacterium]